MSNVQSVALLPDSVALAVGIVTATQRSHAIQRASELGSRVANIGRLDGLHPRGYNRTS